VDTLMYIMFGDTSLRGVGPAVEHWRPKMTALGTTIADAAWQTFHRDSIVDELAGTTVPVLAVAGAEDHAYPPSVSDAHIATATGGRSVTLEAAGHSVALEQPDRVPDLLLEHFAASSGSATPDWPAGG
jgi:3-oxoadipate enol-lactonase